jgi:hypothetical protein
MVCPRRTSLQVGKVVERVAATFAEYAETRQQHSSHRLAADHDNRIVRRPSH